MDTIRLGLISCWYHEKSCGRFAHSLATVLKNMGVDITVISANCQCFRDDPFQPDLFFSPCQKIKFPDLYWKPAPKGVNYLRSLAALTGDMLKGYSYLKKARFLPILHYQQTQGSFGFLPLLSWLSSPAAQVKRVVSIHEIDSVQKQLKIRSSELNTTKLNKIYNRADAVIVQTKAAQKTLEDLGVTANKIHIIAHGTSIPKLKPCEQDQIIFCGGHHLTSGKGFDTFLKALLILSKQNISPQVMIYGLNAEYGQKEGQKAILELGVNNQIKWFDYRSDEALFREFQKAMFMVIPYTSSEAGAAVTTAMANAVAVIATRRVGLPEYLKQNGLYVDENNPQDLADKMLQLINTPGLGKEMGGRLYKRAAKLYSWEAIAGKTLDLYKSLLRDQREPRD